MKMKGKVPNSKKIMAFKNSQKLSKLKLSGNPPTYVAHLQLRKKSLSYMASKIPSYRSGNLRIELLHIYCAHGHMFYAATAILFSRVFGRETAIIVFVTGITITLLHVIDRY